MPALSVATTPTISWTREAPRPCWEVPRSPGPTQARIGLLVRSRTLIGSRLETRKPNEIRSDGQRLPPLLQAFDAFGRGRVRAQKAQPAIGGRRGRIFRQLSLHGPEEIDQAAWIDVCPQE